MFSTYNEGKSVVAERFMRTLKNKIFKHMTAISKNIYFDVLDEISKIKNTVPWTYVVSDLNGEEITGSYHEKELQKTTQEKFRIEKVLIRKGDKLYVKWKGYGSRFNIWVDKKDLI